MKKILFAASAIFTIGFASNSFAGGCGSSYVAVQENHCAPRYCAPQYSAPQYCAPQYCAPQYCAPQYCAPQYCAPQYNYIVQEPCHQSVVSAPVCQPCHTEERVIIQQPCPTTYVKPCVETYQVQTPVFYNYDSGCHAPVYNYRCAPTSCGY